MATLSKLALNNKVRKLASRQTQMETAKLVVARDDAKANLVTLTVKNKKLSGALKKTLAETTLAETLSPSHVKRPRDGGTRDAGADLTATLPWEEKVTPTTTAPPQCFQNLPRRKRDRIVGQKYIYNTLVCIWNGKRVFCDGELILRIGKEMRDIALHRKL